MAKIMLVEDDKSLREIYGIRLVAEGYEVVSAGDGEEALALAVQERPDLILSDVMMPKISGFDMLDILRSTPETKGVKVIMMTALSSEDQRQRGESLGANKYLVKSQVGIEDVINAIHEVMGDRGAASPQEAPGMTQANPVMPEMTQANPVVPEMAAPVASEMAMPTNAEMAAPSMPINPMMPATPAAEAAAGMPAGASQAPVMPESQVAPQAPVIPEPQATPAAEATAGIPQTPVMPESPTMTENPATYDRESGHVS